MAQRFDGENRQKILEEKPKHIGNPINCGVLVKDRHRTYYRQFLRKQFLP
jgi:hypothetical protein